MNVQRALKVLPTDAKLTAETRSDKYGSAWNVVARLDDGYERVVTSFSSTGAFEAAHWLAQYDAARQADAIDRVARRIYLASGGDESYYPWPCTGADRYRRIAKEVLDELGIIV